MKDIDTYNNSEEPQMDSTAKKEYSILVQRCILAIETDYLYLLGVAEIADLLNVSKNHLIRLFSKEVGTSPQKYLIKYKLEQSKILLADHGLGIEDVALASGFSTANYFAKVFKKEYDIAPSEYRKDLPVNVPRLANQQMYL